MSGEAARTALDHATAASADLLRTALLCKLAVDLEDPALARRAARLSVGSARLLAGLDFPPYREADDEAPLPEVDELLERMPTRRELEEERL